MMALADVLAWSGYAAALLAAVALSSLISGMETGLYSLNKVRLDLRAEGGFAPARYLRKRLRNMSSLLAVVLAANNAVNYAASFLVTAMLVQAGAGEQAEWYCMLVATPLLFIFGESVPKNFFQRHAELSVYRLVWLLRGLSVIFTWTGLAPLIQGFSQLMLRLSPARTRRRGVALGHEGLALVVAESTASGVLTHFQSIMAERVMRLSAVRLTDVMIPMARMAAVRAATSEEEFMQALRHSNYSRLPVLDAEGHVANILDVFDVLLGSPASADGAAPAGTGRLLQGEQPPLVLRSGTTVTDALYRMQADRVAMAVVRDATGRHIGIVTIKDLVEEIVGELEAW